MALTNEHSSMGESSLRVRIHLPCVQCAYDLHGIDPDHACPECGVAAEESLATVLDPTRSRIPPMKSPWRVGWALIVIALTMLVGTLWQWVPIGLSIADRLQHSGGYYIRYWPNWAPLLSAALAVVAAGLVVFLRRPTGALGPEHYRRGLRFAQQGLIFYGISIALLVVFDSVSKKSGIDHFGTVPSDIARHRGGFRFALDVTILLALIGFRPVIQFISLRSLNHRLGRVGRQGIQAMIFAASVVAFGDFLRLVIGWSLRVGLGLGIVGSVGAVLGVMLIAVGEAMLTLALLNATVDAVRLARGVARPSYLREDIIG